MITAEPSLRDRWGESLSAWLYQVGWSVTKALPESVAYSTFRRIADELWRRDAGGAKQLAKNLRRVHPEMSDEELRILTRDGMRSYMRYWCEAFRLPAWSPERIHGTFHMERKEIIAEGLAGDGMLLVPAHMGNWDHAGGGAAIEYGFVASVAERLKPEKLFQAFLDYRESLGIHILGHGEPDVIRKLARLLTDRKLVALLGDRDISRHGVQVDFFGEKASFPAGPAVLGLLTGVPVHPLTLWFDGPISRGYVHDQVVVPEHGDRDERIRNMTQQMAHCWEKGIRDHSQDWHMLQRVWVSDLKERS